MRRLLGPIRPGCCKREAGRTATGPRAPGREEQPKQLPEPRARPEPSHTERAIPCEPNQPGGSWINAPSHHSSCLCLVSHQTTELQLFASPFGLSTVSCSHGLSRILLKDVFSTCQPLQAPIRRGLRPVHPKSARACANTNRLETRHPHSFMKS